MEITRGKDSIKSLVPMLNKVFHKKFKKLLPKLYTSEKYAPDHYVCRIDGKIAGSLGCIKNTLEFSNGTTLSSAGISGVAVKKKFRGRGVMDALMNKALADARAEDVDFMFLSGNRKRYERYGFVPAGYQISFTVTSENVRHSTTPEYTFIRYIKAVHEEELIKIYAAQSMRYRRDDFDKVVKSWNVNKYNITVVIKDSETVGYIVCKGLKVVEFMTINGAGSDAAGIIAAYYEYKRKPVLFVDTYSMNSDIILSLSMLAQSWSACTNESFAILNFWNVIDKLLNAEPSGRDYEFILEIENEGKRLIAEKNGVTEVRETSLPVDLCLKADEAVAALFAPATSMSYNLPFSLKLSIPRQDTV